MKTNINFKNKVAIIGAGITLFRRRLKETPQELTYEAVKMAIESAGIEAKDIEAAIIGSAPDGFDGIHMKGENLADGALSYLKPSKRVFVGGATGVFTPIAAWWHIASGLFDIVIAVAEEKMSNAKPHPQAVFNHIWDPIIEKPLNPNLIWIFAMEMHRYMYKYNIKKEDIALVAVKNKRNAIDHPAAQTAAKITVEDVLNSEVLVWPVQRLDISAVSDGAAAVVLASENIARKFTDSPVWIEGVGWCLDSTHWTCRELAYPLYLEYAGRMAYKMSGIENPRKQLDFAEVYDPFDYKELHHLEGLKIADKGKAPEITREGITERDGDFPVCPSGGLLGVGNPIAAAGMMKVCEIFWQLRYEAEKRQVKIKNGYALAQAWGDLMQVSTVLIARV